MNSDMLMFSAKIKVTYEGEIMETSVGRIKLNEIIPEELGFMNEEMTKKELKILVARVIGNLPDRDETAKFVDRIKDLGFESVTQSGISWGMDDLNSSGEEKRNHARSGRKSGSRSKSNIIWDF